MDVIAFADARAALNEVMDRVIEDRVEVAIARRGGGAVVMISLAEWNAIRETLHLLASPENARRLRGSIAQLGGE